MIHIILFDNFALGGIELGPITSTEEGIIILSNDIHPLKAKFPISFTDDEIDICDNAVHSLNVLLLITITGDGIDILSRDEHPAKA